MRKNIDAISGKIEFFGILGVKTQDYQAKNSKACSIL